MIQKILSEGICSYADTFKHPDTGAIITVKLYRFNGYVFGVRFENGEVVYCSKM